MKKFFNVFSLASTYALGNGVQHLISLLLIPVYTSFLYPIDFGVLSLLFITMTLITSLIPNPLDRFYYSPDYVQKNGILLFNLFLFTLCNALIIAVIFWYFDEFICQLLFGDLEQIRMVRIYSIIVFFNPIYGFLLNFLKLREMAKHYAVLSVVFIILFSGLATTLLIGGNMGVLALIYGNIFAFIVVSAFCMVILVKHSEFKLSASILREPLQFGYPLILSRSSTIIINSGDRYILSFFHSVSAVGIYSFGYKMASFLNTLMADPLKLAKIPAIMKSEDNPEEQKKFIADLAVYYYIIGACVALGLSLVAKEVIMLLARREEFWPSWEVIPFIAFSFVLRGLGNFMELGLVIAKKAYYISANLFVSALTNIALNFILIPAWGLVGAASAFLISCILWGMLNFHAAKKFFEIPFELGRLAHITLTSLLLYLVSLLLADTSSVTINMGIKLLIFLSYPVAFFVTGFFKPKELEYLRKLWGSIRKHGALQTYTNLKTKFSTEDPGETSSGVLRPRQSEDRDAV